MVSHPKTSLELADQHLVFLISSCSFLLIFLNSSTFSVQALNVGVQAIDASVSVGRECSRVCESEFCAVPPFLRYGKYCGLLYSGCPGEKPCDGLDACCMQHDTCIQAQNRGYLSQECSEKLLNCMHNFRNSARQSFRGNKCDVDEVINVISLVMEAALLAGRALHRP